MVKTVARKRNVKSINKRSNKRSNKSINKRSNKRSNNLLGGTQPVVPPRIVRVASNVWQK